MRGQRPQGTMPRIHGGKRSAWLRAGMLIALTVSTTVATSTAVLGMAWAGVLASGSTGQNVTSMVSNLTITASLRRNPKGRYFPVVRVMSRCRSTTRMDSESW